MPPDVHATLTTHDILMNLLVFALSSFLIAADIVVEKYEGIDRDAEWTAEAGVRKQFTQFLVLDFAAGRRYTGISQAWFATAGSTITMSLKR